MRLPADFLTHAAEEEEMPETAPSKRQNPPWWVWVVIMIGVGELGWFGTSFLRATQQSAATATEITDIQHEQAALTASLTTLDADVQTLNVNVAVLSQKLADREQRR